MLDKFRNLRTYLNKINPSTLSGTCDIIAIKYPTKILSTPFRARFGKQQVFCLYDHSVTMHVNGKNVNINLKLGKQGEVLFNQEDSQLDYTSYVNRCRNMNCMKSVSESDDINYGLFEKYLQMFDKDELLNARRKYRQGRIRLSSVNFYVRLMGIYKSFQYLLESKEHRNYLVEKHSQLEHVFMALIDPGKGEANVSYSACLHEKVVVDHMNVFERHKVLMLDNIKNLVVHLKCNCSEFFITYSLYSHLFFLLKSLMSAENVGASSHFKATLSRLLAVPHIMQTALTPTNEQFKRMNLNYGRNTVMFKVDGTAKTITTYLFLLKPDTRIVISDIDGTITKSDAWGHVYTMMGKDWTHSGVAKLFDKISKNDYLFLYLSSRPLSQIRYTRKYLASVVQDGYSLPIGPILHSPDGFFGAIYREIISRKPEEFKIACLKEVIDIFPKNDGLHNQNNTNIPKKGTESENLDNDKQVLECSVSSLKSEPVMSACIGNSTEKNMSGNYHKLIIGISQMTLKNNYTPFIAGFGNRKTDVITYKEVGIHRSRIFTIDSSGKIVSEFTNTVSDSYLSLNTIVEKVFPPLGMTAVRRGQYKWWLKKNRFQ